MLHDSSYLDRGDAGAVFNEMMMEAAASRPLVGFHLPALFLAGKTLDRPLCFEQCRFHGVADFSSTDIKAPLTFSDCHFVLGANFTRARFGSALRFKSVTSDSTARFDFTESAIGNALVVDSVLACLDFTLAGLTRTKFIDSTFTGDVSLVDAKLTSCTLGHLIFQKQALFNGAKFSGCTFRNLTFQGTATFASSVFDPGERSFVDIDMSSVSLINADISGAKFREHTKWDGDHGHRTYDIRMFYSDPSLDRLVGALGVLRSLRDNHEYHLMYRAAGQFFVREMELRRRYSLRGEDLAPHSPPRRIFSLTGLYFWTCGYGESLRRACAWMSLLFGAALGCFAAMAEMHPDPNSSYASLGVLEKMGAHVERTLAAFFPLGGGDLPDYAVRAVSIPLLGTLFVVIRRRLERKLRH